MAPKKKSRSSGKSKKRGRARNSKQSEIASPLALIQHIFNELPDAAQDALLAELTGFELDEPAFAAGPVPRSAAAQKVDRLIDQAREQATAGESIALLEQAVEVARQALGRRFDSDAGRMGDSDCGYDYLEARAELAAVLGAAGQEDGAIAHAQEILRLDPADPACIRPTLLEAYLNADRTEAAARLLHDDCPEPWPEWLYGRLLIDLRRGIAGAALDRQLKRAHRQNPHVLSLLLGERMPAPHEVLAMDAGDDGAAQMYAQHFLPAWRETPGAVSWLRDAAFRLQLDLGPCDDEESARPTPAQIAALPVHDQPTWVVGVYETAPLPTSGKNRPAKHWFLFAFTPLGELIEFDLLDKRPRAGRLWEFLSEAMHGERGGARPQSLLVYPSDLARRLERDAAGTGIQVCAYDDPERLIATFDPLIERVRGGQTAAAALDPAAIRQAPLDPDEVWEAAIVELPRQLVVAGRSVRVRAALVMSRASGAILWHEMLIESPPATALDAAVRMAIARPAVGAPRRPREVVVRDHDEALSLQGLSEEAGFVCESGAALGLIDAAIEDLAEHLVGGKPAVVLIDVSGLARDDLERFYTAGAEFYRAKPWKQFAMDEVALVEPVETAEPQAGYPKVYGLVMGQSGITLGLSLYFRLDDIRQMFHAPTYDKPLASECMSVTFGEEGDMAPADIDAIEQFGWPVAAPEAFPVPMRVHPGPEVAAPSADELRLLTAAIFGVVRLSQSAEREVVISLPGIHVRARRLGPLDDLDERA